MKTLIKTSLILGILLTICTGCTKKAEKEDGYGPSFPPFYQYFIPKYIEVKDLFSHYQTGNRRSEASEFHTILVSALDKEYLYDNIALYVAFTPDYNSVTQEEFYKYLDDVLISQTFPNTDQIIFDIPYNPIKTKKFDSLRVAHNDLLRPRENYCVFHWDYATFKCLESLNITSDTDYNADYQKGSLLNDLIIAQYNSAKIGLYVVTNNFYDRWDIPDLPTMSGNVLFTYEKPLNELNQRKEKLLGSRYLLYFSVAPEKTSTHRFTITYTDEDGKVLTTTTAPITIKGAN